MGSATGLIFNIQHFSIHDGPGIRTTVFMKGCSLRCYWCHNPESLNSGPELQFTPSRCIGCGACVEVCPYADPEKTARFTPACTNCSACAKVCYAGALSIAGRQYHAEELAELLLKDKKLLANSGGGVTFSGGEPLLQADFVSAVSALLKKENIHTAIETASNVPWESFEKTLPLTDLFICDIKAFSDELHQKGTGAGNRQILDNLTRLSRTGAGILFRIPIIPCYNDTEDAVLEIGGFVQSLEQKHPVELLAFHNICAGKYDALGREFAARDTKPPSGEFMGHLKSTLEEKLDTEVIWKP
ncbi:glycyl-radical enzyme activating protein [Leadbettera azotonutricia]|uniref:Pyruvate formate-lyase-activating enzyme (PFL-activatingenzyme) (Formate-C-acetyltransferase-activating enzyme) n=1 Tax=Leadbettera azotonutricia (strain ATCC BAA-888 / DSM 13862 / ZAS-9) TaxID=545695 RepID=F5YF07_LEAAZ|nr:glycyl-radical enzyme activating protein [Leadbettera azotonutricia]AEF80840.1 pyruvate formate-lyase-activating enzyme (PFL-activatingenzyme) (Formate-C-acetyltransferase-activating enzyme) [Leadbettera azotonutricia ZAS-9]